MSSPNNLMSSVQIHENATTDKLNVNPLLIREEVSLIFRWLDIVPSLPPLVHFKPSENQAMKKWKWVLTPPPRETQAGEYEVIIPTFPRNGEGANDWCITYFYTKLNP